MRLSADPASSQDFEDALVAAEEGVMLSDSGLSDAVLDALEKVALAAADPAAQLDAIARAREAFAASA